MPEYDWPLTAIFVVVVAALTFTLRLVYVAAKSLASQRFRRRMHVTGSTFDPTVWHKKIQ